MFQVMLKFEEFFIVAIKVHTIPQNISLVQNKIFVSFPTKIMITFTENKKFISNFSFFSTFVDMYIIQLSTSTYVKRSSGRNFKKENKVAIFTFFEVF